MEDDTNICLERIENALRNASTGRPALSRSEQEAYEADLHASNLVATIDEQLQAFREKYAGAQNSRGKPIGPGANSDLGKVYYQFVRKYRPQTIVETGVCNGVSTAFMLQALHDNGAGTLYSIDLPEFIGATEISEHWSQKGGAAVPADREPGWLVPQHLRDRWNLVLGKSTDRLRPLLEQLGSFDCFVHDSEHSYECMMFEYIVAWRFLRPGGLLASNDIQRNDAFVHFSMLMRREPYSLSENDAFIVK